MLELLFLLLPIAAAYGWYMGRRSAGHQHKRSASVYSKNYFTGLNFLLSDQPDKAVDQFISLMDVDSETIETHLALGRLFRQRGEVDRAIRIHQNLLARPSLTTEQHDLSLYELANDYLQAGLMDRSRSIFEQLSENSEFAEKSQKHLMTIFQGTKEWPEAVEVGQRLLRQGHQNMAKPLAHFHCELAVEATKSGDTAAAVSAYKQALDVDPSCSRASLQLAELYLQQHNYGQCQSQLIALEQQDIEFFSEAIPLLRQCYEGLNDREGLVEVFQRAATSGGGISTFLGWIETQESVLSQDKIERRITEYLIKSPNIRGFYQLMVYQLANAEPGRARDSLHSLKTLVGEQIKIKPKYRCRHCGFCSQQLYWQCPSCQCWGEVKPIRGLDGE